MSIRGRRSHSRIRGSFAPPPSAGEQAARESGGTPEAGLGRLVAGFGRGAYAEARRRQRQARASEAAAHWAHVASLIARHAGEPGHGDFAARAKPDSGLSGAARTCPGPGPSDFLRLIHWTSSNAFSASDCNASGSSSSAPAPTLGRSCSARPKSRRPTPRARSAPRPRRPGPQGGRHARPRSRRARDFRAAEGRSLRRRPGPRLRRAVEALT